jgi:hypothetical protein
MAASGGAGLGISLPVTAVQSQRELLADKSCHQRNAIGVSAPDEYDIRSKLALFVIRRRRLGEMLAWGIPERQMHDATATVLLKLGKIGLSRRKHDVVLAQGIQEP